MWSYARTAKHTGFSLCHIHAQFFLCRLLLHHRVLEGVKKVWTEYPKAGKGKKGKPITKDRIINKMFLRGDSVILVLKNPN